MRKLVDADDERIKIIIACDVKWLCLRAGMNTSMTIE